MKARILAILLSALLVMSFVPFTVSADDAIEIKTAQDLSDLMHMTGSFASWTASYRLAADIDLSSIADQKPIGNATVLFAGTFDGDGHTISGINITGTDGNGTGLFGTVANCTIKNLTISGTISAGDQQRVGGLVGSLDPNHAGSENRVADDSQDGVCTIENCVNLCNVTGKTRVGGIMGIVVLNNSTNYTFTLNVTNCVNKGTIVGYTERVGGVMGSVSPTGTKGRTANITYCTNEGEVSGKYFVGGIVGNCDTALPNLIAFCVNNGHIVLDDTDGAGNTKDGVGGIAGRISCFTVDSCVNNGTVEMKIDVMAQSSAQFIGSCAGGIVGRMDSNSFVYNCVNNGTVIDVYAGAIGGIVGSESMSGTDMNMIIENCLNNGVIMPGGKETEKADDIGEVIGSHYSGGIDNLYYTTSATRTAKNNDVGEVYSETAFASLNADDVWENPANPTIKGAGANIGGTSTPVVTPPVTDAPVTTAAPVVTDAPVVTTAAPVTTTSGSTTTSPSTGDVTVVFAIAAMAVVACGAVIVLRRRKAN